MSEVTTVCQECGCVGLSDQNEHELWPEGGKTYIRGILVVQGLMRFEAVALDKYPYHDFRRGLKSEKAIDSLFVQSALGVFFFLEGR